MKKRIISLAVMVTYNINLFAQSVYMHEAQEDAMRSDGNGISGILGVLTLIVIGIVLVLVVPLMVKEKISDVKYSKKYDRRRNILENEAITKLNTLAINNDDFAQIRNNPKWKDWFLKGYRDGVDNGETEMVKKEDGKPMEYEKIPWEEYSERKFGIFSREEIFIKFECGGDAKLSKLAYDEGRRNGVQRRKIKGDLREMLG